MTQEVNGRALKKAVARTVRQIGLEDDHLFTRVSDLEPAIVELARLSAALNTSPSLLIAVSSIASGNVLLTDPGKAWYERYLSRRGSCLMFASNTRTLVRACSRIIWLYEGRVIMDRPAIEVHREFVRFEAAKDDRMQQAQLLRRYALELVQPKITTY
ncbi:putative ABC-type transport system involved in lysophospholipase L1 biosynthesis ATPase subunit [Neomicrococcus aestuarii]|uniref:Putative ABC-type transport system involved in lysophospholipase L1 biosynthesis ATPase subunit n=1 Tax=Neomicrococcus aestuarii TaxID=556325 RepID=A0A7W8TSQ1_9MICC|nr:hypothetical protein [Neomicrococcus aestuarii]MBB5511360.1 putative ABC-type transport system involved in lysophospholipase L1 biosynthesis ATPase subunit [Neomicrococcus aestuarii]